MENRIQSTYSSAYSVAAPKGNLNEFESRGTSVSNYAYKEEQNLRFRPYMEDACKVIDSYMGDPDQGYFAVFDGHGGPEAVDYCKARLHEELRKCIQDTPDDVNGAFVRCFQKVDNQLRLTGAISAGTTATIAIIRREGGQKILYTANVGDSKGVIISSAGLEQLTYDHKGSDYAEIDRIVSSGGVVIRGRVAGQLAVSRALGDHHLKPRGVSNEPYISRRVLNASDICIILASDGIWDAIEPNSIRVNRNTNSTIIASDLLQRALANGSQDNICVLVICL